MKSWIILAASPTALEAVEAEIGRGLGWLLAAAALAAFVWRVLAGRSHPATTFTAPSGAPFGPGSTAVAPGWPSSAAPTSASREVGQTPVDVGAGDGRAGDEWSSGRCGAGGNPW